MEDKTTEKIQLTSVGRDENDNIIHDFRRVNITGAESISVRKFLRKL